MVESPNLSNQIQLPGPDGIEKIDFKAAITEAPEMFEVVMQKCLNEGKSTVDAMLSVTKTADVVLRRKRRGICYCAVDTLDGDSTAC